MMRGLFAKEWRDLRPFVMLELALIVIDVVFMLVMPSEQQSLGHEFSSGVHTGAETLALFCIAFAIGSGLLVREIDGGTLQFLDGLPLARSQVFGAKLLCGLLVAMIEPFGGMLMRALMHVVLRDSLDYPLHTGLLVTHFGLTVIVGLVGLCLGMLLGFMRFLGWLMLALCILGVTLLKRALPAAGNLLDPTALLDRHFVGNTWPLPLSSIGMQLGLALLFGMLALGLFNAAGGVLSRFIKWRASGSLSARLAVSGLWFVLLVCVLGGGGYLVTQQAKATYEAEAAMPQGANFTPIAAGHARSRHYTFSYPALSGARVSALVGGADQSFDAVAALLQVDAGGPIDVDLGGTTPNHSGTAYFDRIRMNLASADPLRVLAHETSHVLALRLAGGEKVRELNAMVVFNEGLASWVESRTSGGSGISDEHELVAAIVSARHMVKPRQLTDAVALARVADENLKYPLGAIFVDRFVRRYGVDAPKRLLRTLARADFPHDLKDYVLWQTTFQLSGFDVDLVFDDYARHLKQLEGKYARQLAELPRPRGRLVTVNDELMLVLQLDTALPADWSMIARLRPSDDSPDVDYVHLAMLPDTVIGPHAPNTPAEALARVPMARVVKGQVCFQPGVGGHRLNLFEAWTCLPVSSATRRAATPLSKVASTVAAQMADPAAFAAKASASAAAARSAASASAP